MGRDAAGVIGIRLARAGDEVVSMSVVQPEPRPARPHRDRLRQARRPSPSSGRKHRGGQGVMLIPLEGRKTGRVAAVQQVTEADEELLLISAGGQVVRTQTNTINRYSSGARGVITMRLNEGDRVVGIAAFREGLAERGGMGDNDDPDAGPGRRERPGLVRGFGAEEAPVYSDSFDVYTGNANPGLARKICRYLGVPLGQAEVFSFANENIFVKILDNVREKDVFLVQPTCRPVNQSIMELLIMIDAFKRASAGRITAVDPVLRLRPLRQEGPAAGPDHGPPRRRHDHRGRRRPGPDRWTSTRARSRASSTSRSTS